FCGCCCVIGWFGLFWFGWVLVFGLVWFAVCFGFLVCLLLVGFVGALVFRGVLWGGLWVVFGGCVCWCGVGVV
ncbi:hypothetical protein RA272_27590, partial [Pseudomonas syringae pv. tagetis]|uniref:hypothetical protein n=1 Tax=Pseudomonas syringae group genomosp. 7 TaxID=251699 RepID=UPI0037705C42